MTTVPADWAGFAEVIGGASGALTGLLFVSVSLNATRIAGHQGLRSSAAQTLVLFLTPLFMAAALLAKTEHARLLLRDLRRTLAHVTRLAERDLARVRACARRHFAASVVAHSL